MIELILGVTALVAALVMTVLTVLAAGMSDSPSTSTSFTFWEIGVGLFVIEAVLYLIWFGKHLGWT